MTARTPEPVALPQDDRLAQRSRCTGPVPAPRRRCRRAGCWRPPWHSQCGAVAVRQRWRQHHRRPRHRVAPGHRSTPAREVALRRRDGGGVEPPQWVPGRVPFRALLLLPWVADARLRLGWDSYQVRAAAVAVAREPPVVRRRHLDRARQAPPGRPGPVPRSRWPSCGRGRSVRPPTPPTARPATSSRSVPAPVTSCAPSCWRSRFSPTAPPRAHRRQPDRRRRRQRRDLNRRR